MQTRIVPFAAMTLRGLHKTGSTPELDGGIMNELSGIVWCSRFPGSKSTQDLAPTFRTSVDAFIDSMRAANASVLISATLRPPERAYLMHNCWRIAREGFEPAEVEAIPTVQIDWVHQDVAGFPDTARSKLAAAAMVNVYTL